MLTISAFGTFGSFRVNHIYLDRNRPQSAGLIKVVDGLAVLDQSVIVYDGSVPHVVITSRRSTEFGIITWIGYYQHLPQGAKARRGSYCGVGISLLETTIDGYKALHLLRSAAEQVLDFDTDETLSRLDIGSVTLDFFGVTNAQLETLIRSEAPLHPALGLGCFNNTETCLLDLYQDSRYHDPASYLDDLQKRLAYRRFNRALVPLDANFVLRMGFTRARIMSPSDIEALETEAAIVATTGPVPQQPAAGGHQSSPPERSNPPGNRPDPDHEIPDFWKRFSQEIIYNRDFRKAVKDIVAEAIVATPARTGQQTKSPTDRGLTAWVGLSRQIAINTTLYVCLCVVVSIFTVKLLKPTTPLPPIQAASAAAAAPDPGSAPTRSAAAPSIDPQIGPDGQHIQPEDLLQAVAVKAKKLIDDIARIEPSFTKKEPALARSIIDFKADLAVFVNQASKSQKEAAGSGQAQTEPDRPSTMATH